MARRRIDEGDEAAAKGHRAAARDCYLRAACFLGAAITPSTARQSMPGSWMRFICR